MNEIFDTNFTTVLKTDKIVQTNFETVLNRLFNIADTNLTTRYALSGYIKTDLRTSLGMYDDVEPKRLDDIIVKKDGTELSDVDYSTLRIQFNLNRTPSNATFKLGRRHDDLDHLLDGTTVSVITNKNKITIYDDTILLFTGYITKINTDSGTDTVNITAEDIRCKINNTSLTGIDPYTGVTGSLSWGGKYGETYAATLNTNLIEIGTPLYVEMNSELVEKSIGSAFLEVMSAISTLISGYESFSSGYIPEFTSQVSDCGSLIDTLVTNTANMNWYTDENEYLRFQKVAQGTIKSLPLSSLTAHRHVYDVILDDITLNKMTNNYYQTLVVNLGKFHTRQWLQNKTNPDKGLAPSQYVKNLTWFGFQSGSGVSLRYVGEGIDSISQYMAQGFNCTGYFIYQWLVQDSYADIAPIVVGSGAPSKTIYLSGYGKTIENKHWEEMVRPVFYKQGDLYLFNENSEQPWLYEVSGENSSNLSFATDAALFELSQNNKLLSEANITMLLDAYEFYGITFKDLINISNTISPDCYVNANGFPLNISGITIDCSNRIVSLNITNYGKTYCEKSGSCMTNYIPEKHTPLMQRLPQIVFSGGYPAP
jgi:hypothetical protein